MFKKLVSFFIGVLLVVLVTGTAMAAESVVVDQQQAIEITKKMFPQMTDDQQFDADYREDDYRGKVWSLHMWEDRGPHVRNTSLHVDIDANTGTILSFNYTPDIDLKSTKQRFVTRDQAREIAFKFAQRMQPGLIGQMKIDDDSKFQNFYGTNMELEYHFRWHRVVNGIPVQSDGLDSGVDAATGEVKNYNFTWNKAANFPVPGDNKFSSEKVTDMVVEKLGLYPAYTLLPDSTSNNKVQMIYAVNSNAYAFDVLTGKPVLYDGKIVDFAESKIYNQQFTPDIGAPGMTLNQRPSEQINQVKAQAAAEEFYKKMGYQGKVVRSGGGSSTGPGYRIEHWNYRIENDSKDGQGPEIDVDIDTNTGKVTGFNIWQSEDRKSSSGKQISYDDAKTIATKFIKSNLGINYPLILREIPNYLDEEQSPKYDFCFERVVNGVPFNKGDIWIDVDRYSGKVTSYHSQLFPVTIPKVGQVIGQEKAADAFKAAKPLELCYQYNRDDKGRPSKQAQLVYAITNIGQGIDALTGKTVGIHNTNEKPEITNHWASGPLEILANSNLLPKIDFNPDSNVSRREAIRVLMAATDDYWDADEINLKFIDIKPNDQDLQAIKRAVQMDMLENQREFNPESNLTREQLAVWIVNGLGYKELTDLPINIEINFKDGANISNQYKNHVAIAAGIGVFNGDKNGYFNPQQTVTWAELATIVTRVGPKLKHRY